MVHNKMILLLLIAACNAQRSDVNKFFEKTNLDLLKYNNIAAKLTWDSSLAPNNYGLVQKSNEYLKSRIAWQHSTCNEMATLENAQLLNRTQRRQSYLLCRGTRYTFDEASKINAISDELQSSYTKNGFCLKTQQVPKNNTTFIEDTIIQYLNDIKVAYNINKESDDLIMLAVRSLPRERKGQTICIEGEVEFQRLMVSSRDEKVLKFLWMVWRENLGKLKSPFKELVMLENAAAWRNGYPNIGSVWREELETPSLREFCRSLYEAIRPMYDVLHAVVRHFLRVQYGSLVPEAGPIPAHLLGDLWSQNWASLVDLIVTNNVDLDTSVRRLGWSNRDMVKKAQDLYQSMSLPPLPASFWRHSILDRPSDGETRCHGSAADMFRDGDFRLIYCSETAETDFYVLHHELGHIHYYMAYEHQPAVYRQGANSAFHESIGDAMMLAAMTPQHLHRLGIVNDSIVFDQDYQPNSNIELKKQNNFELKNERLKKEEHPGTLEKNKINLSSDNVLILKRALNEIPQIPFALMLEQYRWKLFENGIDEAEVNEVFWRMAKQFQGIEPALRRGEEYFDVAAKFHVPDNTPYIRYFLSSFLHHQLFEELCRSAVFGRRRVSEQIPFSIPLARCDIYGSKAAGKLLMDIMARGASQPWQRILQETTGKSHISPESLKKYYQPLFKVLSKWVNDMQVPVGW